MKKRMPTIGILLIMVLFALNINAHASGGTSVNNSVSSDTNGNVIINGITLSSSEIAELKDLYGVEPQSGNYWYDKKCGLYGVVGYPAYGLMYAGHDFGSLMSTVSNGNTGVYINGREIPRQELYQWSQLVGSSIPAGSYWLDQYGNAGHEGSNVPLVNLYTAAQRSSYSNSGGNGDNFWSTGFSAGNSNSSGQGYVSVPGYGPVGYGF